MDFSEILILIDAIIDLFNKYGVTKWSGIMSDHKNRLVQAINNGENKWILNKLEEFLALYGGMGSFTDIFITNLAGDQILPKDVSRVNRKLRGLQSKLYSSLKDGIDRLNETRY